MTLLPLVLVTDTNIWIDLDHGGLLELMFQLPYQICTADFARVEIRSVDIAILERYGLIFQELGKELIAELFRLRQHKAAMAIADLAAFLLAREQGAVLVTGDRNLVRFAIDAGVDVHGLLWLMDEMIRLGVLEPGKGADSLKIILEYGARLPAEECIQRIRVWSK
jgi:hypothetical protein